MEARLHDNNYLSPANFGPQDWAEGKVTIQQGLDREGIQGATQ